MTGVTTPSTLSGPQGGLPLPSTEPFGVGGDSNVKWADAVADKSKTGAHKTKASLRIRDLQTPLGGAHEA
jgi:hypothetical protein